MASKTTSRTPDKRDDVASMEPTYRTTRRRLENLGASINKEIRSYPPPIAGCDQQFNKLIEDRRRVARELRRLDDLCRQGSVREADIQEIDAFLRSTARGTDGGEGKSDRTARRRAAGS